MRLLAKRTRSMKSVGPAVALLWAAILVPQSGQAAQLSFDFSGTVSRVQGGVFTPHGFGADGFTTSLPVSGGVTYTTSSTDTNPGPHIGRYNNAVQDLSVTVGTYYAAFAPGNSFIRITNSNPGAGSDVYELRVNGLSGSPVNGYSPTNFLLQLTDPTGTAFSNDTLGTAPSLSSFATSQFRLIFGNAGTRVQGGLTSVVPLPAAAWLFGAGLIALIGLGSRGLTSRKEASEV